MSHAFRWSQFSDYHAYMYWLGIFHDLEIVTFLLEKITSVLYFVSSGRISPFITSVLNGLAESSHRLPLRG